MNQLNSVLPHYFFQVTSQTLGASDPSRNSGYILPLQGSCQEKKSLKFSGNYHGIVMKTIKHFKSTCKVQKVQILLSKPHQIHCTWANTSRNQCFHAPSVQVSFLIYLYSQVLENCIPNLSCTYHTLVPSLRDRWAQLQSLWELSHYWFLWTCQSLATQVHFSG